MHGNVPFKRHIALSRRILRQPNRKWCDYERRWSYEATKLLKFNNIHLQLPEMHSYGTATRTAYHIYDVMHVTIMLLPAISCILRRYRG